MYHIETCSSYDLLGEETERFIFPYARAFETVAAAMLSVYKLTDAAFAFLKSNFPQFDYQMEKQQDYVCILRNLGGSIQWEVVPGDWPIHIESRNVDNLRLIHEFFGVEEMLSDWDGDDPTMGDNEILLVKKDGDILYCSLGKQAGDYGDTLRTAQVMEWFSPGGEQ